MSWLIESLLMKVTLPPTATVSSLGLTPLAVIVTVGAGDGDGVGDGVGAGVGGGVGAVGVGDDELLPHPASSRIVTAAETAFASSKRADALLLIWPPSLPTLPRLSEERARGNEASGPRALRPASIRT